MKSIKTLILLCGIIVSVTAKADLPIFTEVDKPLILKTSESEFVIKLDANPTTGYDWFLVDDNASRMVTPVSSEYVPPVNTDGKVGAGGYRVWHFKLNPDAKLIPCSIDLKFIYARAWEMGGNTKTITIRTLVDQ